MATPPRPVFRKQTNLITRRCRDRKFLLTPCKTVNDVLLYVVAAMAEKWEIDVHGLVGMSSHYHAEVTDVRGNEPDFLRDVNSSVSKALNRFYGRSGRFWGDGQYHKLALIDGKSQLDRLIYLYTNPVAAGLVRRHEDWPGVLTRPCFQGAYEIRVKRPEFYFREKKWPEEAILRIVPIPSP